MNWFKNYTIKTGFLIGKESSLAKDAQLFIYRNGLCIVQTNWGDYISVTRISDTEYRLNGAAPSPYEWTTFLVGE